MNLAKSAESKARLLGLTEDIAAEAGDVKARRDAIAELEALGAGDEEGRVAADAAYRRARLQLHSGDLSGTKANAEKALQRFEQLGDISMQADALRLLARVSHLWGDQREALKFYRSSLPLEREAGDRAGQAEVFDHLGLVQIDLDDFTTALDYFEAAREICAALAQNSEAASLARQVCDTALQTDQPGLGARGHLQLAQILSGQAGEEAARQARELARPSGLAHVDILALIREAEIALQEGDLGGAEEASAEAIHKLSMRGRIEGPEEAVLCTRARCLKALGRNDEASELLKQTREAIREKADKIEDPELRRSFLDIPLNRAVMGGETTRGETSR